MDETAEDLVELQALLDRSAEAAGSHLRSILAGPLHLRAAEACTALAGILTWTVATVGGDGRPLAAPVDGIVHRGRLHFGTSPASVRARHLARRPAVSATYVEGERLVAIVHGDAHRVDLTDPAWRTFRERLVALYAPRYGSDWDAWAASDAVYFVVEPRRMFVSRLPADA